MKLKVNDRFLILNDNSFRLDDLYTSEFYSYTRKVVDDFYNDTYAVNGVYDNIYQDYFALKMFLEKERVDIIDLTGANEDVCFYLADLAAQMNIPTQGARLWMRQIRNRVDYTFTKLASLGYFMYLMLKVPYTKERIEKVRDFAVIRSKGGAGKMKRFTFHKEFEYPFNNNIIYRLFPKCKRLGWVCKAYIRSFSTMKSFREFYGARSGKWTILALNNYYKKRIVHTELYELMMDEYMSHFEGCNFYTANNLDRFSCIEDKLAKKYHIHTYNIPHGIEYGFKYPKGFSSDTFYANTQYTADYLNKLYNTSKYVFDEEVTTKMFKLEGVKPHEKYVVYFSEPREVEVNIQIVQELIPMLREKGIRLYLKLHPGDVKSNYDNLDAIQLTDYGEAMCGNICIARKSTCLLEAIYNDSTPIAIITNPKDQTIFDLFPSLNTDKIIKTYNVKELYDQIMKYY